MNCREAAVFFHPYIDRELSREDVTRLEAHIHRCRGCAGHLEFDRELRILLQNRSFRRQISAETRDLIRRRLEAIS